MVASVKFNYIYRDASNYKALGYIIFNNPNGLTLSDINNHLLNSFRMDGLFIASQIRIPEVFLYLDGDITVDDHCFHEFISVEDTLEAENDVHRRSIFEFIKEVEHQSETGWKVFDPTDPFLDYQRQNYQTGNRSGVI